MSQLHYLATYKPCTLLAWFAFLKKMPRPWIMLFHPCKGCLCPLLRSQQRQSQFSSATAWLWDFSGLVTMNLFDNVIHTPSLLVIFYCFWLKSSCSY